MKRLVPMFALACVAGFTPTIRGLDTIWDPGAGQLKGRPGVCRDAFDDYTINVTDDPWVVDIDDDYLGSSTKASDKLYPVVVWAKSADTDDQKWTIDDDPEAPTAPTGYDVYRVIGFARTRTAGTNVWWHAQYTEGGGEDRWVHYASDKSWRYLIDGGTATTATAVDFTEWMPSKAWSHAARVFVEVKGTCDVWVTYSATSSQEQYMLPAGFAGDITVQPSNLTVYYKNDCDSGESAEVDFIMQAFHLDLGD